MRPGKKIIGQKRIEAKKGEAKKYYKLTNPERDYDKIHHMH